MAVPHITLRIRESNATAVIVWLVKPLCTLNSNPVDASQIYYDINKTLKNGNVVTLISREEAVMMVLLLLL